MKKIISIIVTALMILTLGTVPAFAASDICNELDPSQIPNYETVCGGGGEDKMQAVVKNVLNTVYLWIGIIAVIVVIIGGVKYMTSQGDAAKVKSAKDTIMYAVIGIIVAVLAFAITNFILGALGA